jgi:hypothetical protein
MAVSPFDESQMVEEQPPIGSPRVQLRLHHIFALTAVMSVMLGISGPRYNFGQRAAQIPPLMQVAMTGWGVLHSILTSVAITAVGYGIALRRRGVPFFNQPGHWLMVDISATTVITLIPQVMFRILHGSREDLEVASSLMMAASILFFVIFLFRIVLNIYIGLRQCEERRWSWVFYLKAVASVLQVVGDLIVLLMISRASVIDRRLGWQRDIGHRCGVALQVGLTLLTVFFMATIMLSFTLGWWRPR